MHNWSISYTCSPFFLRLTHNRTASFVSLVHGPTINFFAKALLRLSFCLRFPGFAHAKARAEVPDTSHTMFLSSLLSLFVFLLLHHSIAALCPAVKLCLSSLKPGQSCPNLLPVPPKSFTTPLLPSNFTLTPVRAGVYVYSDSSNYNSLILRAGSHLAMLDVVNSFGSSKPNGSRTRLTDAAEIVLDGTSPSRIDVVYSHAHLDHIGGATRFVRYMRSKYPDALINIWGTAESEGLIKASTRGLAPQPTIIVTRRGRTLRMSETLQISMSIVGGHTQQDLLLHIPPSADGPGVTMMVDIAFPRWAPPFNFAITQDFREHLSAYQAILGTDFGLYIGGHIRTGDRKDVEESLRYAQDVMQKAKEALREATFDVLLQEGFGKSFDPESLAFGNPWFRFVIANRVPTDICYRKLLQRWGCTIGGVDLMARGHCFTAIMFLLVDQ